MLAVIKARDFDDGLAIANNTEYGLTGAVYSMRRDRLERARREFHVGNLYFNRKCTGALVGADPFGGFNMSGTDSKAGGRDYLLLFTQAKVISEMVMRARPDRLSIPVRSGVSIACADGVADGAAGRQIQERHRAALSPGAICRPTSAHTGIGPAPVSGSWR